MTDLAGFPVTHKWPAQHPEIPTGYNSTGVHAATSSAPIPASHRRDVWLGWRTFGADSFPRTEVKHLDPIRIFRAAFTSRSCESPHSLHTHDLTISPFTPRGPLSEPHEEQTTLVFLSLTT